MPQTPLTPTQLDRFRRLACALSPENLFCDGEVSRTVARARARALRALWAEAEHDVGRPVSEEEVWAAIVTPPR